MENGGTQLRVTMQQIKQPVVIRHLKNYLRIQLGSLAQLTSENRSQNGPSHVSLQLERRTVFPQMKFLSSSVVLSKSQAVLQSTPFKS